MGERDRQQLFREGHQTASSCLLIGIQRVKRRKQGQLNNNNKKQDT